MGQNWGGCVLKLDFNRIRRVVISPNGRRFVRLDHDAVEIYNIGWSDMTHSIKFADWAGYRMTARFAPNGEHLAVCSDKGAIQLLDTNTGRRIWELKGHENFIQCLAFSPNGKLLASASPQTIILWDLDTGQRLQMLDCKASMSMCFSSDNQRLASGSYRSGEMRVWDVTSGDCIWSIKAHDEGIDSLAFVSGEILVSGSCDERVKIWDLTEKICTQILQTTSNSPSVVSFQDGRRFAYFSTRKDVVINICNERGVRLQSINVGGDFATRHDLVFLPGPQLLARTSSEGLTLWDLASKSSKQADQESSDRLDKLVLSWDGKYLASGLEDHTIRLWDTSDSTRYLMLDYVSGSRTLTFSGNNQLLIGRPAYFNLVVWDTANGNRLGTYGGYQGLQLSPDGQQMAGESVEDTITIHDLSTGDCIQEINAELWEQQFLVNGNRMVLVSDKGIKVWDILQSRCIASLSFPSSEMRSAYIYAVALSNDSNLIALDGDSGPIQVWDLTTQELRHELGVLSQSPAFFQNGELMLYHNHGYDTIEILKLKTGTLLQSIQLPIREWQKGWQLDPNDQSRLCTELGVIDLSNSLRGPDFEIEEARRQPPHNPHYLGYGLSLDGAWILKGSTRILCLPLEYRGGATAAGSTVAIAHDESGRVSVLRFAE
jgi:WD40 repeat protein